MWEQRWRWIRFTVAAVSVGGLLSTSPACRSGSPFEGDFDRVNIFEKRGRLPQYVC